MCVNLPFSFWRIITRLEFLCRTRISQLITQTSDRGFEYTDPHKFNPKIFYEQRSIFGTAKIILCRNNKTHAHNFVGHLENWQRCSAGPIFVRLTGIFRIFQQQWWFFVFPEHESSARYFNTSWITSVMVVTSWGKGFLFIMSNLAY